MVKQRKVYAGIGSRETPSHICDKMVEISRLLERKFSYTLRSGGAVGSDTAFEQGVIQYKEIFYTYGYRVNGERVIQYDQQDWDFATKMFKLYHPSKGNIKNAGVKNLLIRNTFQIFGVGIDSERVDFVLCYTPDGSDGSSTSDNTGGTGQALRIAHDYKIPVYNLKHFIGLTAKEIVDFIISDLSVNNSL